MSVMLSFLTRSARLSPGVLLLPHQRPSAWASPLGSHPSTISMVGRLSIMQQPFSTNGIAYAKRTPRPKQRIVKEQKLKVARIAKVPNRAAVGGDGSRSGIRPDSNLAIKAQARQWKKQDGFDTINSAVGAGSGPRSGSRSGFRSGPGAGSKSNYRSLTSPQKRVSSTSISVTSMEKGSRNPQFEHAFAPGFASSYLAKSARKGPPAKTGNAGRDKAAAAEYALVEAGASKRRSGPNVRGFVPVRFALKPIASDVHLHNNSTSRMAAATTSRRMRPTMNPGEFADPQQQHPQESVKEMLDRVANSRFETIGLHPDVERGVLAFLTESNSKGIRVSTAEIKPTEIQAMTIPASIDPNKKSPYTLCAAETGSGKTLAYLVPVMHRLKTQEDETIAKYQSEGEGVDNDDGDNEDEGHKVRALSSLRRFNQPRAIVLLPSRELVAQVASILKEFSHSVKLRTLAISHSWAPKGVMQRLASGPVDIIVATPASLLDYLPKDIRHDEESRKVRGGSSSRNRLSLASLTHLVIDEADTMFDHGFGEEVTKIVKQAKNVVTSDDRDPVAITVVSATLPKKISDTLDNVLPGILKITTPSLHKSLPGLHQTFLDLKPYFGNRPKAILDILAKQQQQIDKESRRKENTLIFCNTKHSCELLYNHLKTNQVPGLLGILHGDASNREEILEKFKNDDYIPLSLLSTSTSRTTATEQAGQKGGKILISTDIASRGIDTTAVNHVVLYDFPVTIVDYLHRVGRTARGGRGGRATSLVGQKDRNLAERIMMGIRMGTVLS
ncbi:MAG: P-loop containing nucleoside triphosphate hydrolase protein [Benniella sp.]|nr:MAG: P-loop containing nucleoside triphosphate hydrolase protein [Benniella sp.]